MPKFLLDANLSPLTREYLVSTFGLNVSDLQSLGLGGLQDSQVVELAKKESRVIVFRAAICEPRREVHRKCESR
jgi:predicted nuclease of predicted toxin-antitoxin system